ncbi:MAG: HAD family acid phosphatase [Promethearchaeota archaeon]
MMREIFIFDIDGCVLPQLFPNIRAGNKIKKKRELEIFKKARNTSLYPEFIQFYQERCRNASKIIFVSGRKASLFKEITEAQLKPLRAIKDFSIHYYPDKNSHEPKVYFNWKAQKMQEIILKEWREIKKGNNGHEKVIIRIFDDMFEYFPQLRNFLKQSFIPESKFAAILIPTKDSRVWSLFSQA